MVVLEKEKVLLLVVDDLELTSSFGRGSNISEDAMGGVVEQLKKNRYKNFVAPKPIFISVKIITK